MPIPEEQDFGRFRIVKCSKVYITDKGMLLIGRGDIKSDEAFPKHIKDPALASVYCQQKGVDLDDCFRVKEVFVLTDGSSHFLLGDEISFDDEDVIAEVKMQVLKKLSADEKRLLGLCLPF